MNDNTRNSRAESAQDWLSAYELAERQAPVQRPLPPSAGFMATVAAGKPTKGPLPTERMKWAREARIGSVAAKCVLFVLTAHSDARCECRVSLATLAAEAEIDRRTVSRAIVALEAAGFLLRIPRPRPQTTIYVLHVAKRVSHRENYS